MNPSKPRRDFLKTSGAALAAIGAFGAGALSAPAHAAGSKNGTDNPKSGLTLHTDGTHPAVKLAKPPRTTPTFSKTSALAVAPSMDLTARL